MACQTQFSATGMHYPSVFGVMDIYSIEKKKDCFERIRAIERHVLEAMKK